LLYRLETSNFVANLPLSLYQYSIAFAVIAAWAFPQPRLLRPMLLSVIGLVAAAGLVVGATLLLGPPRPFLIAAVVGHGALLGIANGIANTLMWETLSRGIGLARRGTAFSLAFGLGPLLAVTGSLLAQIVLNSSQRYDWTIPGLNWTLSLGRLGIPPLDYPWNFAILFLATGPCMIAPSLALLGFILPPPGPDPVRPRFVAGVFGGIGEYFRHPLIRWTVIAYLLVYSGLLVMGNLNLYTPFAMGAKPEDYVGLQQALRFAFKSLAGFFLGWLVVRRSPRAALIATILFLLLGVVWGLVVPGMPFLIAFGLLGAGELMGAYFPNYVMNCSPVDKVRRNMAITNMVTLLVGLAPMCFGALSDAVASATDSQVRGLQASLVFSLSLLLLGLALVLCRLPPHPMRQSDSTNDSAG
jgi:hypothetical protein